MTYKKTLEKEIRKSEDSMMDNDAKSKSGAV